MKKWQLYWTYFLLAVVIWHSIRDAFQFLGIQNLVSTSFVEHKTTHNVLWNPWNTVIIEFVTAILVAKILYQKKFGFAGWLTVFISVSTVCGFAIYWFLIK